MKGRNETEAGEDEKEDEGCVSGVGSHGHVLGRIANDTIDVLFVRTWEE